MKTVKCTICKNYQRRGATHKCAKNATRTIYGVLQEPIFEICEHFTMRTEEKERRRKKEAEKRKPIKDKGNLPDDID